MVLHFNKAIRDLTVVLILLLATTSLQAQTATAPSLGDGSIGNPYQIATLENLCWLSQNINVFTRNFIQTADIDASETKNWDGGSGFLPIGDVTGEEDPVSKSFTGRYNGKGHIISGLYINRPSNIYVGLFGLLSGATLDSICLVNCDMYGGNLVGGLVGYSTDYSMVQHCFSSGNVSGDYQSGGLIGNNNNATIQYCYFSGSVSGRMYAGGLVGGTSYNLIQYCYSTGSVSGDHYAGGLAGYNVNGTIQYCYSIGSVPESSYTGGLVGQINSSATQYCYWDKQASGQSTGYTGSGTVSYVTGLATSAMKEAESLSNMGSFSTIWDIRNDSTYAALRGINNNAPFAFADTMSGSLHQLLRNDYDYETLQENQVIRIEYAASLKTGTVYTESLHSISNADSLKVSYRVGELLESGDTLWGNRATSILMLSDSAPVFTTASLTTAEDTPAQLRLSATDAEGDKLSYSISTNVQQGTAVIGNDLLVYTPNANFNGSDSVQVIVSDMVLSDTAWVYITVTPVNDAPVIISTAPVAATEYVEYTYTATATDVDADLLTCSLYNAPAGMSINNNIITWLPIEGVLTSGEVTLTISDGYLSDTETFIVTVTPVDYKPVARDTVITTLISTAVSLILPVSDIDGTISKVYIDEPPGNGMYNFSETTLTYTPGASFTGTDTITWFAKDNLGWYSNTATLVIQVIEPVAVDLAVADTTVNNGTYVCFNAENEITVAGSSTVIVENNALANFIAGTSIRFLPGFHAANGSVVHGWITTDGSFCDLVVTSIVQDIQTCKNKIVDEDFVSMPDLVKEKAIKVYPNPSNGKFTIECLNMGSSAIVHVYNLLGTLVYQSAVDNKTIHYINMPGIQRGIYLVKVMDGKEQLTKKIIVN